MPTSTPGRTNLLLRNGIYSILSWGVPSVLALLVTPAIVRGLGNEAYGLYAVIIGFISYSFSFGVGKTAAKYVAEYRATGETDRISEIVSSVLWFSLGFGFIAIIVIALTARFIVTDVLSISPGHQETAVIGLYLGGITILIAMLSQVFQFVLQGLQRFDRFLFLTNLSALLLNLGSVAIVLGGLGVLPLVVWNGIVVLVVGLMFYLSARRLLPEFKLRFTITVEHWRAVLRYALSIVAYQIFGNVLLLFERGWIVRKFGAAALTFYVVPMILCFYYHAFISSLALVLFPVINELLGDREKLLRLYRTASKLIVLLTGFFVVTSVIAGRAFLGLWMDAEFAATSYPILVPHVGTFAVLAVTIVAWQTIESFRAAFANVIVTILWFGISVTLMVAFAERWQSVGVGWARFLGVLAYLPLIWYVERKFLGHVLWGFWLGMLGRIIFAAGLAGLIEWLVLSNFSQNWVTVTIAVLSGAAIFTGTLALTHVLDQEEKHLIRNILTRNRIGAAPAV